MECAWEIFSLAFLKSYYSAEAIGCKLNVGIGDISCHNRPQPAVTFFAPRSFCKWTKQKSPYNLVEDNHYLHFKILHMSHLLHRFKKERAFFIFLKSTSCLMPACIFSTANASVHLGSEENQFMRTHLAVSNGFHDMLWRKCCGFRKNNCGFASVQCFQSVFCAMPPSLEYTKSVIKSPVQS